MAMILAVLLAVMAASCVAAGDKYEYKSNRIQPEIMDRSYYRNLQVHELAKIYCLRGEDDKIQFSNMSTIVAISEFFDRIPSGHEHTPCKDSYEIATKRMKEIINTSNENVCSDAKVSLIEDFHASFVSTSKADVEARGERAPKAPRMLTRFFINYVYEVATLCQQNVWSNLWEAITKEGSKDENHLVGENTFMGKVLSTLGSKMPSIYSSGRLYDSVLVWDVVQGFAGFEVSEGVVDPATGEQIKLFMKVKDASHIKEVKQVCLSKLRPIYSQVITPVVRLSSLGYVKPNLEIHEQVLGSRTLKAISNWYAATQFCETILPIKFVQDESLSPEAVVIITREEATKLGAGESEGERFVAPPNYKPSNINSFVGYDRLKSVDYNRDMVAILKLDQKSRQKSIGKALSQAYKSLKSNLKSLKGRFLMEHLDNGVVDLGHLVDKSALTDEDVNKIYDDRQSRWSKFVTKMRINMIEKKYAVSNFFSTQWYYANNYFRIMNIIRGSPQFEATALNMISLIFWPITLQLGHWLYAVNLKQN